VLTWKVPPSSLYSNPAPVGLVTVITALPAPAVQSTVCTGIAGEAGCALITTLADETDVQPNALVTV
jgi:hypothetical protein